MSQMRTQAKLTMRHERKQKQKKAICFELICQLAEKC